MKNSLLAGITVLLLGIVPVSGCSDSTGPDPALDQAAAIEIATELMSAILSAGTWGSETGGRWSPGGGHPDRAPNSPRLSAVPLQRTILCDEGGDLHHQGMTSVDVTDQGYGTTFAQLVQTPSDCGVSTSSGTFTVNGNPSLGVVADFSLAAWVVHAFDMRLNGGFTWSGAGGSGRCTMDVTYAFDSDPETFQVLSSSISGSMCGHDIQVQI